MSYHKPDYETPCEQCGEASYTRWTHYYPRWSQQLCTDCAVSRMREEAALNQANDYRRVLDPSELAKAIVYGVQSNYRDSETSREKIAEVLRGLENAVAGLIFEPEMIGEYQFLNDLELSIEDEVSGDSDPGDWWGDDDDRPVVPRPVPSGMATV